MTMLSNDRVKLSYFHTGKTPFLKIESAGSCHIVRMDDAADAAGISRQTLARWCDGTQPPQAAALRLFQILYLGHMPWPEWQAFRMCHGRDREDRMRWLITHPDVRDHWTAGSLMQLATSFQEAAALYRQIDQMAHEHRTTVDQMAQRHRATVDLLQATVTALSTRQAPPLPCAEIIPIAHYQQAKKSPA